MARTEARIFTSIWDHEDDFVGLTPAAQRVFFLVLSQRGLNYCGVIDYAPKRWAALAKGDTVSAVTKAVAELERARYFVVDRDTDELWVRSFIRRDRVLDQPQLIKAMMTDFGAVASPRHRAAILDGLGEGFLEGLPAGFPKAFGKGSPQGIPEPFRKAFAKVFPEGYARAFPAPSSRPRAGARPPDHAPPPLPPPPPLEPAGNPSVPTTNGAAGPKAEKDQDQDIGLQPGKPCQGCDECSPPDPLAERLATLWPGRPRMVAESKAVVATCRTVAADDVIDEAIGTMLALDSPPRTPRYLLSTVLNRLVAGGAYGEGDPRLDVLRTKTPAVRG